ncbi:MAG TPA: hypothetical protein VJO34_05390 [Methylomirabilota bacterium]|nr:hypothetical protein [Methylomirabilota bacterium]
MQATLTNGGIALALLVSVSAASPAFSDPQLSDDAAKKMVQAGLQSSGSYIKLGRLQVVEGKTDYKKAQISLLTYKTYERWEKVGAISITREWDRATSVYRYGDFSSGILAKVIVDITPKGQAAATALKEEFVRFPYGSFRVIRIVKNEGMRAAGEDFRTILFLFDATWDPLYKRYAELTSEVLSEKRKGRVLLRYDPFASNWVWDAQDYANAEEEFSTDNVPKAVALLGLLGGGLGGR